MGLRNKDLGGFESYKRLEKLASGSLDKLDGQGLSIAIDLANASLIVVTAVDSSDIAIA